MKKLLFLIVLITGCMGSPVVENDITTFYLKHNSICDLYDCVELDGSIKRYVDEKHFLSKHPEYTLYKSKSCGYNGYTDKVYITLYLIHKGEKE